MMRYALYYAPAPDSLWWRAGCRWIGRDAAAGAEISQRGLRGVPHLLLHELTVDARRYGFHATLKAPFRLKRGYSESDLATMAEAFCSAERPIALEDVRVRKLGKFLALRPAAQDGELGALAMRCTMYFDMLRDLPAPDELARRRSGGLSARHDELLMRWGYPYTEEEYRFHMTLTDDLPSLADSEVDAIRVVAEEAFEEARASEPLVVDGLTIFREDWPGAPFSVWQRFPFCAP